MTLDIQPLPHRLSAAADMTSLSGQIDCLPLEVLERIAYYVATLPPQSHRTVPLPAQDPELRRLPRVYPPTPSDLIPFLCTNSHIYWKISLGSCPRLYARIFRAKFDTSALGRR